MNPADYRPAPAALEALRDVDLVAVVGPSGVGKTTLMNAAIAQAPELHFVISDTSRPPRPQERDGVDYFFRTRQEMLERISRGTYSQVPPRMSDDLYATSPEAFTTGGVGIMAVLADAIPHFRSMPFRSMRTIFILPPDYEVWQARLGESRDAQTKRLAEARRSLAFAVHDTATHYLINGDLATAVNDLVDLALDKPLTSRLLADQQRAKTLAADFLRVLDT